MAIVIIPAYKPDEKLISITDKLWIYGCEIIVVDDGSGAEYQNLFDKLTDTCILLHHPENYGKGTAIKTALHYVQQEVWDHQTIGIMDADGQHTPEDMMKLFEVAETHKQSLILGVRMIGKNMPWKSRIGNLLTRSIFQMFSGVKLSDTQTGLRAFDLDLCKEMHDVQGERYEYEMNVLMNAAHKKIPIIEVPIQTIYMDKKNSTSHFRVLKDSFRIYRDLMKFSLSSFSSFCLDYLLFTILTLIFPTTALFVLLANVMARMVSAWYNYSLNTRFVFRTKKSFRSAIDYFALAVFVLCMNNVILEGLIQIIHLPVYPAKLLTECILFLISWLVQSKLIFRNKLILPVRKQDEVQA